MSTAEKEIVVKVNGADVSLAADSTLAELLAAIGLAEARVAVELNQSILPRSQHGTQRLSQDDAIEIVHAIGGG